MMPFRFLLRLLCILQLRFMSAVVFSRPIFFIQPNERESNFRLAAPESVLLYGFYCVTRNRVGKVIQLKNENLAAGPVSQ